MNYKNLIWKEIARYKELREGEIERERKGEERQKEWKKELEERERKKENMECWSREGGD